MRPHGTPGQVEEFSKNVEGLALPGPRASSFSQTSMGARQFWTAVASEARHRFPLSRPSAFRKRRRRCALPAQSMTRPGMRLPSGAFQAQAKGPVYLDVTRNPGFVDTHQPRC
jgi:hypothetical protein